MRMKRFEAALLAAALVCLLVGCGQSGQPARQGTAEHEVLTLTPVPEDKMLITMRAGSGIPFQELEAGIEAQFPDVDIVVANNTWLQNDIDHGCHQDIILAANSAQIEWNEAENLIDLSGERYMQNYYLASLRDSTVNDKIYYLPGPSNIYGIVYNKDMFAEHGWQVPATLDEFIVLCQTIEEAGIRAIQPALYYRDAGRQFFTGFTYEPIFAGVENTVWHDAYRSGEAVMAGHMEPAFEIMRRFVDAGILRTEDYEVMPDQRSFMLYEEETCAMILETQDAVKYRLQYGGDDAPQIGMMPFLSGNGPDSDYLLAVPNYFMAANSTLEQPGNEEKLARVKEIFAFLSTAEGQKAVMPPDSTMISSIRGMEWNNTTFLSGVKETIEKGNVVKQPFFVGASNTALEGVLKDDMVLFTRGQLTAREVMADLDAARDAVLAEGNDTSGRVVVGVAEETFTVLQTAQLFADIFRERADAQIGLCLANTKYQGCNYKLYQGELVFGKAAGNTLEYFIDDGFKNGLSQENGGNRLVRLSMTGDALLETLGQVYQTKDYYPDAYWVASGLNITFAPWAGDGNRIVSVTLADGSELAPEAVYTVAAWNGSIDPALIQSVETCCEDSAAELFRQRVEAEGSIKPELDECFVLDWDVVG